MVSHVWENGYWCIPTIKSIQMIQISMTRKDCRMLFRQLIRTSHAHVSENTLANTILGNYKGSVLGAQADVAAAVAVAP